MSSFPTPRADANRAMREARWQREQDRQTAERKAAKDAAPAKERPTAKPIKARNPLRDA
jgi:hypothetical protein